MIKVNEVENYLGTLKERIDSVNFVRTLIDEDDINKDLNNRDAFVDLHMIYAVIPEVDVVGKDDYFRDKNYIGFMILHKTDYRAESAHADWLKIFAQTQETTLELRKLLLQDKRDGHEYCNFLKFSDLGTIHIAPVKWMSGCNGWMLTVDIITDF